MAHSSVFPMVYTTHIHSVYIPFTYSLSTIVNNNTVCNNNNNNNNNNNTYILIIIHTPVLLLLLLLLYNNTLSLTRVVLGSYPFSPVVRKKMFL